MYALVQFLVDKVKTIVPVQDIKNFDHKDFDVERSYEVFWQSPNGEGTGYWYAVVLLVEETEELIEQRKKRVKLPTLKKLEELLAITLEEKHDGFNGSEEETRRKNKEVSEKRSVCEKDKLRDILKKKLKESSQGSQPSTSQLSTSKSLKLKRRPISPNESSDGDEIVLKSELDRMTSEYHKVSRKLKIMQGENIELKKKNNKLQDLNMSLQAQLLSMLSTNGSLGQTPTQKVSETVGNVKSVLPQKRVFKANEEFHQKRVKGNKEGIFFEQIHSQTECSPNAKRDTELTFDGGSNSDSLLCHQESMEILNAENNSAQTLERVNPPLFGDKEIYSSEDIVKSDNGQMELAPGIFISNDQWSKAVGCKNMNVSRLTRNLAVSLWGSDNLRERSVTGLACKRFAKNGVEAKKALTPVKIDAVQNGVRLWLKKEGKGEEEILKQSSMPAIRKMLSDKIMDLVKQQKKKFCLILYN